MEGLEESSPIDLSTKREKSILEDKSNLLQSLASIATPQQLLSLCAQLAASREVKTEVNEGQNNDVTPPATPRQEVLRCAAMGCGQHFASRGSQLWHLMEEHGTEKLLSCDKCGRRFNDRDQINEHDCHVSFRPVSVGAERAAASSPDADRGSVPAQPGRPFSMIEPEQRATVPSSNLFSQLFAPKPQSMPMVPGPMFPFQMPHFPPTQHHHAPHPFFMRPMEPRSEMFQPRQDSNEDDWEALMEVSTSDEGEKIRALVGDKAMPTTDPNQCILCRRVLSCKSALQMHYRTHTGERPFKCKICQRAFTTKGNLKTHMGVHRAKHSFRGVPMGMGGPMGNHMGGPMGNPMGGPMSAGHMGGGGQMGGPMQLPNGLQHTQQCPICQKRCVSAMQLQSHMMEHRNSLTGRVPQLPQAPPTNQTNGGFPPGFPFLPFFPSSLRPPNPDQPAPFNLAQLLGKQLVSEEIRVNPEATPTDHNSDCEVRKESRSPPVLALKDIKSEPPQTISSVSPSGSSDASAGSDHSHDQTDGSSVGRCDSDNERKMCLPADSTTTSTNNTDHKPSSESLQTSPSKVENPLEAMQKMWAETEPPPPRQLPVLSKHQCGVCFKHFSSSSALQIHMRTHTGDKPFKCEMCGRAFTTRGNLKVHMGTHVWQQSPSRRGRRIFDSATSSVTSPMKIPTSLGLAMPPPMGLFPPAGLPNMEMMMMLWRTVCSVCQKVCASPSELEQHLKEHLGGSTSRETESPLTSVAD